MPSQAFFLPCFAALQLMVLPLAVFAQQPPYDVFPDAEPPYYRVRYEASTEPGGLSFAVNYTVWIPEGVKTLRGVIVHQHGCGEGSCKSGLTGAFDLHWQALARRHDCALLAPAYEQPQSADCQMWCDPRNGSAASFQQGLIDLGKQSAHPELATVPWALWGHSGGGHWAGGMVLLYPERVAAAWLRSGVPLLEANPKRSSIKPHTLPDEALGVPMMCNLGTKEGVTVKDGRFAGVWPANQTFFEAVRGKGGLVGVAVDPLTAHECGNQRYLAIPWLDACLTARLPKTADQPLRAMPTGDAWLAAPTGTTAVAAADFQADPLSAAWLPNQSIAQRWMQYVTDTAVSDTTPPPAPSNVKVDGNTLVWEAEADLESGLARFIIERDGEVLAEVPQQGKNPYGRVVFQNLQYSDTPTQPLVAMRFTDSTAEAGKHHVYRVIAVNTVGLKSPDAAAASSEQPISRVLFGSCIKQDRPIPILKTMLAAEPELLLFLGDNIYADTSDIDLMRAKYKQLAGNEDFAALRSACPILATWDDHDYGVNDGGADFAKRDEAQQAYLDFWGEPAASPKRNRPGVYDAKIFGPEGKRLQVIMLDTRYFRSPLKKGEKRVGGPYVADNDPQKTMLGETQWKWLEQQLRTPAEVRVIGSSIQFVAAAAGQETWSNLPHERQRLIDLIAETGAGGVIVLSGDRHWSEVSVTEEQTAYPLVDVTSSSLNQKHPRGTPTENRFRSIPKTYHEANFGVLSIDWDAADPKLLIEIRDIHNETQIQGPFRLSHLQPQ
ncbi:alkaline phosphatase D family protein [Roseimaritima ulvae]|uniref:Alkaline phosphatase D n=1 Tax=Roseimaritima ulvae TaxID=980254 RepID=A0A5B9QJF2_9BACT|nr:alkaline phosphatase D family protein [Roseimaritima ulvae]QEG39178.1 Alkaline phosphatase D precursor [Roseimaritima ulvae]